MNRRVSIVQVVARWGVVSRTAALFAAVAVAYLAVAPVAWAISNAIGLLASAVAAGLCLAGATLALMVTYILRGPHLALQNLLLGMLLRMGVPLMLGLVLHTQVDLLAAGGMLYYLVGFYFVTLTIETVLTLPGLLPAEPQTRKS
jgi:hypothetical protein